MTDLAQITGKMPPYDGTPERNPQLARLERAMQRSGKRSALRRLWGTCAFCATAFGLGHVVCVGLPFIPYLQIKASSLLNTNLYENMSFNPYNPKLMLAAAVFTQAAVLLATKRLWWTPSSAAPRLAMIATSATIMLGTVAYNTPHMHDMSLTLQELSGGNPKKLEWFLESSAQVSPYYLQQLCTENAAKRPPMTNWQKIRVSFIPN